MLNLQTKMKHLNFLRQNSKRFFNFWKRKTVNTAKEDCLPLKDCFAECREALLNQDGDSSKLQLGPGCPKVLIIGAGIAGLSAACHLHCRGVHDITVLESSNRHGGRIHSCWLGDASIEYGPCSIQGASLANPVFNLANLANVLKEEDIRAKKRKKKTLFLTRDGRTITEYKLEEMIFSHIINQAKKLSTSHQQLKSNLLQFISLRVQQELLQFPPNLRYDSERILFGLANGLKSVYGANLSQIKASALSSCKTLPGNSVRVSTGFSSILTPLLTKIPKEKILLNKCIVEIAVCHKQYPGSRVIVKASDGEEYEGDFVIVTIPIGVLQARMDSLFGGDLPDELVCPINKIGVGYINNVYFEYSRPWWSPGSGTIRLAWSGDELTFRQDWTKGIGKIFELPNSRTVLGMTIGGEEALLLEKTSELEIAIEFTKFLRKFTGDSTIPYPANVAMSRWGTNIDSMGSTVYMSTETKVGHFKTLARDGVCTEDGLPPALLFAGDGTIPHYYGSVVGARKSGIREADRILKYAAEMCNKKKDCEDPKREAKTALAL